MDRTADRLATVLASPAAVAVHDKAQWLAIFARYNIVEDPVGSQPHLSGVFDKASGRCGNGPLSRFFDTFIAPNEIAFHVERDIVCDNAVLRDLDIEIAMASAVRVRVPMHLLYELVEERGEFRIFRLAAHWELLPMVRQAMGFGWASVKTMSALGWRMFRLQGIAGIAGFCRALSCVGERGKREAEAFVRAYNAGDQRTLEAMFDGGRPCVGWPASRLCQDWGSLLAPDRPSLRVSKLLACGYTVSASCELGQGSDRLRGIMLFEFTRSASLYRVTGYWADAGQAASSSPDSG